MNQTEEREREELEKLVQNKGRKPWLLNFLKNFFLWVVGSTVGVVPIYLKQIEVAAAVGFPESYNLWQMTLNDFDFSFTSVSALFVLFLEGCLLNDEFPAWKSFFRLTVFLCLVTTAVVYFISYFYRSHFFFFWNVTQYDYNIFTLGCSGVLGLICHIAISLRKEETA